MSESETPGTKSLRQWPFEYVPYERWDALSQNDKGFIEGAVLSVLLRLEADNAAKTKKPPCITYQAAHLFKARNKSQSRLKG